MIRWTEKETLSGLLHENEFGIGEQKKPLHFAWMQCSTKKKVWKNENKNTLRFLITIM